MSDDLSYEDNRPETLNDDIIRLLENIDFTVSAVKISNDEINEIRNCLNMIHSKYNDKSDEVNKKMQYIRKKLNEAEVKNNIKSINKKLDDIQEQYVQTGGKI